MSCGVTIVNLTLMSPIFAVSGAGVPKTILLRRSVEIYQWEERSEEREDTTYYTYRKVWSNRLIDSSDFMEGGHDNPTVQYIREREDYAADVTLNAFRLSDSQIRRIGQEKTYALQMGVVFLLVSLSALYLRTVRPSFHHSSTMPISTAASPERIPLNELPSLEP